MRKYKIPNYCITDPVFFKDYEQYEKNNEIHNINQHKNNYNNNENKTIENENLDLDFPLLNSKN